MANRQELRAGTFVVLSLLVLGAGTLWIIGFSIFGGNRLGYEVEMQTSGGVRQGDAVRVAGIESGRVDGITLMMEEEWPVRFRISVQESIRLTAGSSARITSEGLLGAPFLEILPGPVGGERLPAGSTIRGKEGGTVNQTLEGLALTTDRLPALLDQATVTLGRLDAQIEPTLKGVQNLLSDQNVARVSRILTSLEPTIEEVGSRLSALAQQLEALADELEEGLGGVPELTTEVRGLVADVRQAVGPDGSNMTEILDSASRTLDSADQALASFEVDADEVDAMLRDLRHASANLRSLSQTLKQRPGMLLRRRPPPDRKPGEGVE